MILGIGRDYFGDLQQLILALVVGLLVFFVIAMPMFRTFHVGESRLRRAMIERHREKVKDSSLRRRGITSIKHGKLSVGRCNFFALVPRKFKDTQERLLRSAGFTEPFALIILLGSKLCVAIFSIFLIFSLFLFAPAFEIDKGNFFYFGVLPLLLSFVPDFYLHRRKNLRRWNIEKGLPDCLDLLVICAEAGLSLDNALRRVAEEFSTTVPELAEELFLTSVELSFLPERRQALLNLANRTDLSCLRSVTANLIQTEKYGTPLAQGLRNLASEFRENRLLNAEEKAARLPAIMTVPMIVFILPSLFIVLAGPAFIQVAATIVD